MANGLFGGGNGTETNPYLVEDFADIDAIKGHLGKPDVYFKQVSDIEFAGFETWAPVGDYNAGPFMGSYDGAGFKVTGIVSEAPESNPSGGLFGFTYDGSTVSNVFVEATVKGDSDVGGIIGKQQGDIRDCSFKGTVSGISNVGGLVGMSQYDITRCSSRGTVTGEENVGGLVGMTLPNEFADIYDSYSLAEVTTTSSGLGNAGGLVGNITGAGVYDSFSAGKVVANNVSDTSNIGGLIGLLGEGAETSSAYYDKEKSGRSDTKGTGVTSAQLATKSTFSGWVFDEVWLMNDIHPYLLFEHERSINHPETPEPDFPVVSSTMYVKINSKWHLIN